MYPCLLLKVLAEYDLQLCACRKNGLLCACVPVRFARGYTPRLHFNVVAELPGKSPVCFTQVKVAGASPVYFALVKRTGRSNSRGSIQGQRNG